MSYKYTLTPEGRWAWSWEVEEIPEDRPRMTMNCRGMRGTRFGKERARKAAIQRIQNLQRQKEELERRLSRRETHTVKTPYYDV